jgi:hypothetical protein
MYGKGSRARRCSAVRRNRYCHERGRRHKSVSDVVHHDAKSFQRPHSEQIHVARLGQDHFVRFLSLLCSEFSTYFAKRQWLEVESWERVVARVDEAVVAL